MRKSRTLLPSVLSLSCLLAAAALIAPLSVPGPLDAAPFAYIANRGDGTVSVVDIATDTVTSTLTLGGTLLGVTVNDAGTRAYFSRVYQTDITVLDMTATAVLGTFYASATVHGIAVSPDGTRLYMAIRDSGSIQVLDTNTGASITTIGGMSNPTGIAVTPDGGRVYVANWGGIVTVVNALTNSVITTIGGLGNLSGIAVNPDGTRVYVYYGGGGTVSVIDTGTNTVVATVTGVGGGDFIGVAVSPDGNRVYAGGGTSISVIDAASNTILTTIDTGPPAGIDIDPSGAKVYATIPAADTVKVIDTATNTVTATIPVGSTPYSFGKFIVPPPTCVAPPSGLVSWWSGDGHPSDLIGTNNGTMMNGATYDQGKVGQAFSFDGEQNSYVEIPDNPSLNPSGAFTIDGWFYLDPGTMQGGKTDAVLVSKTDGDSPSGGWQLAFVTGRNGWTNAIRFLVMGGGAYPSALLNNAITTAQWYHIAGVYDPADSSPLKLYLNGILVASNPELVTMANNAYNMRIGASYWSDHFGGNDRLNGKADEVEFFSRALTAEEIAAIYSAGSAGKCKPCFPLPSGLVSWWTGDGNANDIAGGNNGTLQGGTTFAPGRVGQAFSFEGVDDYVQIPNVVNSMPEGTIQGWIRYNNTQPGVLFSATSGVPLTGDSDVMELGVMTPFGAHIGFGIYTGGSSWNWIDSGVVPEANRWYHVAGTWGAGGVKIYVDGTLKGTFDYSGPSAPANYNIIGASSWGYSLDGLIDEVELFNRALSAEEIAAIYAAGGAGMCIPPDTTPDPFTFTDQTDVPLNATRTSNSITISGIDVPAPISISACTSTLCEYSVNGGSYSSMAGTVNNGDTVQVRQTSSSSFSTTTDATLTIGGVSDTFSVTTLAADATPDSFTFINQIDVPLSTVVISNTITVSGINTASPISITGGWYSIGGGAYTSAPGTVTNGQAVTVRVMSPANWSTAASATLTIGGVSDTFSVTTIGRPAYTVTGSVPGGHGTIVCGTPVLHGDNAVCTIIPATGYHLQSLADNTVDVTGSVVDHTYTVVNVTSNHEVVGGFAINTYAITTSVPGDHGSISCESPVNYGASSVCAIMPETDYLLKSLTDNGTDVMGFVSGNTYTIVNVTANHTVGGVFAKLLISPKEGTIGTILEIKGASFGGKKGKVVLQSSGVTYALKVLEWNVGGSGVIKGQLTKAVLGGAVCDVVVSPKEPKGALPITETGAFAVKKPEVTGLSSSGGKIGTTVTITGKLFGYKKGKVLLEDKVSHVRKSCKVLIWPTTPDAGTGTGEIQFVVPKMATGTYSLVVQNKVGEDTSESFTVLLP